MKPILLVPAILTSFLCSSGLAQEPETDGVPQAPPEPEPVAEPEPIPEEAPPEAPPDEVEVVTPDDGTEDAVEEAVAAARKKNHCRHICQGDFTVGLGIGYTYFAVQGVSDDHISVIENQDGTGTLFPTNEDPGNRGSGYGITFTGHFGYTVVDNWMIGAAVHYAYQFKTLQLEAFGRYYIKMKQPDTLPFIGVRLGYLWGMGNHDSPVFRETPFDKLVDAEGNESLPSSNDQTVVDEKGENTVFDSNKNSNGYLGAVELGVVHFFTPNVGLFVTLGYQYLFTGYNKGGGVDIKGCVAFSF
ncbi:MAG: hypothetical protein ISR64_00375 [Deltaproteobacteria bacterium]|nr:hypothetical protein [Deltaproteobacteria bacterium]